MTNGSIQILDKVVGLINTHPEYDRCLADREKEALRAEAIKHSLAIEQRSDNGHQNLNSEGQKNIKNLNEAEAYLFSNGASIGVLSVLGNLIDPIKNPGKQFRRVSSSHPGQVVSTVRGDELRVEPPTSESVPYEMANLIAFLKGTHQHPVVRAAEAHLELVRIHPFFDGNGRAARLLQNYCLTERGYPSAVIPEDERGLYTQIVQDALEKRVTGKTFPDSPEKSIFREYVTSKVLESAEKLQEKLERRRAYKVIVKGAKDKGVIYSLAHMIRGYNHNKACEDVSVSVSKGTNLDRGFTLNIVGNIGTEDIERVLEDYRPKHKFHYEIGLWRK